MAYVPSDGLLFDSKSYADPASATVPTTNKIITISHAFAGELAKDGNFLIVLVGEKKNHILKH